MKIKLIIKLLNLKIGISEPLILSTLAQVQTKLIIKKPRLVRYDGKLNLTNQTGRISEIAYFCLDVRSQLNSLNELKETE